MASITITDEIILSIYAGIFSLKAIVYISLKMIVPITAQMLLTGIESDLFRILPISRDAREIVRNP